MIQNTTTSSSSDPTAGPELGVGDRDQSDVLLDGDRNQLFRRHARLEHHHFETCVTPSPRPGLDVSAVQETNGDADMAGGNDG